MNVARAPLQRSEDGRIHEPDDRAHVALRRQLVDRDALVATLFFRHHRKREAFARIFEHSLRLLGFLEDLGDLRQRRNFCDDPFAEQQTDLVNHH